MGAECNGIVPTLHGVLIPASNLSTEILENQETHAKVRFSKTKWMVWLHWRQLPIVIRSTHVLRGWVHTLHQEDPIQSLVCTGKTGKEPCLKSWRVYRGTEPDGSLSDPADGSLHSYNGILRSIWDRYWCLNATNPPCSRWLLHFLQRQAGLHANHILCAGPSSVPARLAAFPLMSRNSFYYALAPNVMMQWVCHLSS